MANKDLISDELLAAYLDGNTSEEETKQVLRALKKDKQLQEVLNVALQAEDVIGFAASPNEEVSIIPLQNEVLPMLQMAALSGENVCAVLCEIFILQRHHITYDKEYLINTARKKDWLKPEGTPLYCLGNLLAYSGMFVSRRYDATLEDIRKALAEDNDVVIGVDREKLYAEEVDLEDLTNHAVVVTRIDNDAITIFDPYEDPYVKKVPVSDFLNAWKESHNYMIQVFQSADEYEPHPINVDSIPLDEDLEELIEAIAENAHDIWAEKMMKDGWTYGNERDEQKKQDPCILPYTALPDDEKEYDRLMAYNTIKLVKKLGYGNTRKQN
ncbi:MAG: RyR domain protein [Prevotella sp.]|nr:RyR domain protein [Prevotella sp.]